MQSNQTALTNPSRPQRSAQAVDDSLIESPNEVTADVYFAIVPEWLLEAQTSSNAVKLYAILRRYADKGTSEAHPSRRTLARRMGYSRPQSVDPVIAELETIGALTVFERWTNRGDRDSNGYRLFMRPNRVGAPTAPGVDSGERRPVDAPAAHKPESLEPESLEPEKNTSAAAPGAFELEVEEVKVDAIEDSFAKVWDAWPRTESKKASLASYRKATKKVGLSTVEGSALAWAQGACARRDAGQFQPLPYLVSWLNQERWQEPAPKLDPVAPAGYDRDSSPTDRVRAALELGARMDAEAAAREQGVIER